MPVLIRIPANMRSLAEQESVVEVDAPTVQDALKSLTTRYPDLAPRLLDADGKLQPFINLFVGQDSIRDLDGLATSLESDSELLIIAALAGG